MEEKMTKESAKSKPGGLLRKAFWAVAAVVGAVSALSESGAGLIGFSASGAGVEANSRSGYGLSATSGSGVSVEAYSTSVVAVDARSSTGTGLHAVSNSGIGAILESTSGVAVQVKGRIQVQGDCIGQAILRAYSYEVFVKSPAATPDSLILLTALDEYNGGLSVSNRGTGQFKILSNTQRPVDMKIAYLIVN